jgi:hypothetical protein
VVSLKSQLYASSFAAGVAPDADRYAARESAFGRLDELATVE